MKITLTSFATPNMSRSQGVLVNSFQKHLPAGCEIAIHSWNMDLLKLKCHPFYYGNRRILDQPRGGGYWIWKPYIIKLALKASEMDDYVLYSDAGIEIISNLQPLIDVGEDILLFNNEWKHIEWCKADVMHAITPEWMRPDRADAQVQASIILIRKTPFTVQFVKDWLDWCERPCFIDDTPSRTPNVAGFREHRHDQAILTCLQIKHGISLHWWPAHYQEGVKYKYPDDHYPIIFNHHRFRNHGTNAKDSVGDPQPEWESDGK